MPNLQKFFFYRCVHCGEWYYTNRIIKTKKCWKCNRSFQIQKYAKFSKNCSTQDAIAILKHLKEKAEKETLSKYKNARPGFMILKPKEKGDDL